MTPMNRSQIQERHVLVVGGGPAGMMAAVAAARAGARVSLLERHGQCGRKLLVTGGGRCNLTHEAEREALEAAFGAAWRFVRPAFAARDAGHVRSFFRELGVPTHVLADGCVFPVSEKAVDVRAALLAACQDSGVVIRTGVDVSALHCTPSGITGVQIRDADNRGAHVCSASGVGTAQAGASHPDSERMAADAVILATGSPAWGRVGADAAGIVLARAVGHPVVPLYPALAPLFHAEADLHALSGHVLPEVTIRLAGVRKQKGWRGPLLLTHTGLSGPAALNASGAIAQRRAETGLPVPVQLHLTPEIDAGAWDARIREWQQGEGRKQLSTLLAPYVGSRLAALLCERSGGEGVRAGECPRAVRMALVERLTAFPLAVTGTGSMEDAMVARGGLDRSAFVPSTLESRVVRGLYAAGEVLDCDGVCGGFNLQWAWSSGHLAGLSAATSTMEAGTRSR